MSDPPVPLARGLAGRPPKHVGAYLARNRYALATRWVRSCRRALEWLNDPETPIDSTWVSLFGSLADRVGFPRVTSQTVDSRTVGVSASYVETVASSSAGAVSDEEALAHVERRIAALREARRALDAEAEVGP